MKQALICAGLFHILLGILLVVFPSSFYLFQQLPGKENPYFWKLAGSILGLAGFAFVFASFRPFVQWPVIFAGLGGHLLIAFFSIYAYSLGDLSPLLLATALGNSLLWIIPFSLILYGSFEYAQAARELCAYDLHHRRLKPLNFIYTNKGEELQAVSERSPVLIVFLRHLGCTFCKETLKDIAQKKNEIKAEGTQIILVHMASEERAAEVTGKYGIEDLPRISDPEGRLYRAFGLGCGNFLQLFGWNVWVRVVSAFLKGHKPGKKEGNRYQMPGIFLIHKGMILQSFKHSTASDRPDYLELARADEADLANL